MNETSGVQTTTGPSGVNRHLELAYAHCSQSWFPVNPELLSKIQGGLKSGSYEGGRSVLASDLKKDFALYLYCVRKLIERRASGKEDASRTLPAQLIENASLEELAEILGSGEEGISSHRLHEADPLQTLRLKHAMISSTTAETLASKKSIDPETAFGCALLRQLGLSLIAWNYPHVYKRVITTLKPNEKVDVVLSRMLGFSPTMLALTMAREWGLAPEIRLGMGDTSLREDESVEPSVLEESEQLENICKVGEALARAADPEHYPTAKHDWEEARTQIEKILGKDGLKSLGKKLEESCQFYARGKPALFALPAELVTRDTQPAGRSGTRAKTVKQNQYLKSCPQKVQDELAEIYVNIDGVSISRGNIDRLSQQIIPGAGFYCGCIYLIEPDSLRLIPRLPIGTARLARFKPVNYQTASSDFDPIVSAFKCQYPIMEDGVEIEGDKVTYVAGVLGDAQKAGVLYLEVSEELLRNKSVNILVLFKALRQTLNDTLNLK